jgi:Domain of unknown function (DUF4249)
MKSIKLFLCISISLIAFASCQKNIEYYDEISKPMLVVHSFITPDSLVTASVSLSRFFLNDTVSFQSINNADVTVIVNGTLKEKLSLIGNDQYQGTYRPAIDDTVKLVVKVPYMNEVSYQTSFCKPPVINSVDTTKLISKFFYDLSPNDTIALNTLFKIFFTLKFTDPGKEKNYYRLIVQSREHYFKFNWGQPIEVINDRYDFNFTDVVSGNNTSSNTVTGIITGDNTNTNSGNKYNVFSDDLFNGKTNSLTFNADYWLYKRYPKYSLDSGYPIESGAAEEIEVFVSLQTISKDYYSYLKSRGASGSTDFYSEPVQITNNIVGGIGFLGSYTSSNIVRFDLK